MLSLVPLRLNDHGLKRSVSRTVQQPAGRDAGKRVGCRSERGHADDAEDCGARRSAARPTWRWPTRKTTTKLCEVIALRRLRRCSFLSRLLPCQTRVTRRVQASHLGRRHSSRCGPSPPRYPSPSPSRRQCPSRSPPRRQGHRHANRHRGTLRFTSDWMGWLTGLEPATPGVTVQCSTIELQPPY